MTPEERQALREKHRKDDWDCCAYCREWVGDDEATTIEVFYPCDVIKVLGDFDNHLISCDTKQIENRNCNHCYTDRSGSELSFRQHFIGERETLERYSYCPLCGEKL